MTSTLTKNDNAHSCFVNRTTYSTRGVKGWVSPAGTPRGEVLRHKFSDSKFGMEKLVQNGDRVRIIWREGGETGCVSYGGRGGETG